MTGEIRFDGMAWEKSITHPDVIREVLMFCDKHKPIETCLESQLSDSTEIFLRAFRLAEIELGLRTKNNWSYKRQSVAKHERIQSHVHANKPRLRAAQGIDPEFLQAYSKELAVDIETLEKKVLEETGYTFNVSSPKQVGEVLFDRLKLPYPGKKMKSGQYSTDEEILSSLAAEYPVCASRSAGEACRIPQLLKKKCAGPCCRSCSRGVSWPMGPRIVL